MLLLDSWMFKIYDIFSTSVYFTVTIKSIHPLGV